MKETRKPSIYFYKNTISKNLLLFSQKKDEEICLNSKIKKQRQVPSIQDSSFKMSDNTITR